jgi:hypothetical protein
MARQHFAWLGTISALSIAISPIFNIFDSTKLAVNAAPVCNSFRVVGGAPGQTIVKKRIELRVGPGNANTDYVVPGGRRYKSYIVTLVPENTADYKLSVNFKYANDKAREVIKERTVKLQRNTPYVASIPNTGLPQPYQVNLFVTGTNGNVYNARVSGCQ